jgi:CheY-like chemotaxis protein
VPWHGCLMPLFFAVEALSSGQEFLDSLTTRRPDSVVLDYQMPGLTVRELRRRLSLAQINLSIFVVTAYDQRPCASSALLMALPPTLPSWSASALSG